MMDDASGRQRLGPSERRRIAELVEEAAPRVFAYVRRAFPKASDAEDIVAETFARAIDHADALRAAPNPVLYLLTIARNIVRDQFRRRRPTLAAPELLAERAASDLGPRDVLELDEARAATSESLEAALAGLTDVQREIVSLRYAAGLTFEEIASLLDIPLGTALSRMNAAVAALRKRMGASHAIR